MASTAAAGALSFRPLTSLPQRVGLSHASSPSSTCVTSLPRRSTRVAPTARAASASSASSSSEALPRITYSTQELRHGSRRAIRYCAASTHTPVRAQASSQPQETTCTLRRSTTVQHAWNFSPQGASATRWVHSAIRPRVILPPSRSMSWLARSRVSSSKPGPVTAMTRPYSGGSRKDTSGSSLPASALRSTHSGVTTGSSCLTAWRYLSLCTVMATRCVLFSSRVGVKVMPSLSPARYTASLS